MMADRAAPLGEPLFFGPCLTGKLRESEPGHGLDLVPVQVVQECAVIRRSVLRSQSRGAGTSTAKAKALAVEVVNRFPVLSLEGHMHAVPRSGRCAVYRRFQAEAEGVRAAIVHRLVVGLPDMKSENSHQRIVEGLGAGYVADTHRYVADSRHGPRRTPWV